MLVPKHTVCMSHTKFARAHWRPQAADWRLLCLLRAQLYPPPAGHPWSPRVLQPPQPQHRLRGRRAGGRLAHDCAHVCGLTHKHPARRAGRTGGGGRRVRARGVQPAGLPSGGWCAVRGGGGGRARGGGARGRVRGGAALSGAAGQRERQHAGRLGGRGQPLAVGAHAGISGCWDTYTNS